MHYPLCDELLYQLSYMAGERSLIEESNTYTTLQHAVEIKSCPSLKCLCKESRCYAHLHNCKYVFSVSLIGVLVWSVSYEIRMRQSSRYCSIGGLIALLNLFVLGFSFVFHYKAKRTQQGNLLRNDSKVVPCSALIKYPYCHFDHHHPSPQTFLRVLCLVGS